MHASCFQSRGYQVDQSDSQRDDRNEHCSTVLVTQAGPSVPQILANGLFSRMSHLAHHATRCHPRRTSLADAASSSVFRVCRYSYPGINTPYGEQQAWLKKLTPFPGEFPSCSLRLRSKCLGFGRVNFLVCLFVPVGCIRVSVAWLFRHRKSDQENTTLTLYCERKGWAARTLYNHTGSRQRSPWTDAPLWDQGSGQRHARLQFIQPHPGSLIQQVKEWTVPFRASARPWEPGARGKAGALQQSMHISNSA